MTEKFEFASAPWLGLAEVILQRAVARAGAAIAGQRLCVSETFTDPPGHLAGAEANEVSWSFRIEDGRVTILRSRADDADYAVRADYRATLPGARTILGVTPEAIEARNAARREAIAAGRTQAKGSLDNVSPAMRQVLLELHNRLAEATA